MKDKIVGIADLARARLKHMERLERMERLEPFLDLRRNEEWR
ncbi:MAG TPA: hypothetical protein VJ646_09040 [Candidatus Binatia bacterium]|nr:hypothetical protein [Candidatus Binatia bacterium]